MPHKFAFAAFFFFSFFFNLLARRLLCVCLEKKKKHRCGGLRHIEVLRVLKAKAHEPSSEGKPVVSSHLQPPGPHVHLRAAAHFAHFVGARAHVALHAAQDGVLLQPGVAKVGVHGDLLPLGGPGHMERDVGRRRPDRRQKPRFGDGDVDRVPPAAWVGHSGRWGSINKSAQTRKDVQTQRHRDTETREKERQNDRDRMTE